MADTTTDDITPAGSDTTSYSTGETSFHQHDYAWRWVGPATGGDWADPSNWVLTDAGQPVDTSTPAFSGTPIPQSEQNADVNVGTFDNTIPNVVVSNSVLYNQIRSLTIWQNGVLKITAQGGNGNVFATAGVENYGTIIIDTPSKVELGGVTAGDGTLTILNNNGNVTLDDAYLNNGTLNLVNSTLGTLATPISVAGGTINLQQNSTLIANLYGEGSTINVDPATVNTLYVNDRFSNGSGSVQNTVINGVSENTHFGILSGSSKPVSATYEANTDGSYTLTITLDNGHAITYPTVNVADGYTPAAHATIVQDGTNGWLIEDAGTSTAPASYVTSDLHQQLAATAAAAAAAGGDTAQYSSSATNYHTHDNTWRWTGSETGGDWYDPKNWTLYDSTGNVVDTSGSSFSGNAVPQSEQNADVSVGTYNSAIQNVIVANAPSYNQIRSLSVWQNGTLEITAQADSTYGGYVFAAAGFENDGTILINTAGRVELGGISANRNGGTLTIMNNDNNVVFDTNKVNNAGTINLINAALGAATNPLSISGGTVNLSQDSSLFLSPGEYISTINVDPNTINTVYVEANFLLQTDSSNAQSVVINGVSANTHFGISGVSSAPTAATYTPNADGSYTLQVTLADGRLLTFGNIHTADGFVPATNASIVQDGTNGWVVEDNASPATLAASASTVLHQPLAATAAVAAATTADTDTTSYSAGKTSFHQHDYSWSWAGPATGGDWTNPSNWVLTDAGQPVDTSTPAFSGTPIPQSEQNADVNVGTYDNTIPNVVVSNSVLYNQIRSLTVWQNGVLKITAQGGNGNVFATAGLQNAGTVIIDTPSKVELGGVTSGGGTLTILNNNGNVTLDNAYLNNGTLNLVNSTLGTLATPISVAGGTINLQQNSTLIANLYGEGSTINVDPATVNTLYVNDRFSNGSGSVQNTVINGVSENTHFGILSGSSKPVSATYEANTDGSYTLTITLDNGHAITYPTVNVADGYTPAAHATIVQDGTNGWLIEDAGTSTAPASYVTSDLHQQLAATAAAAAAAGGDTAQYSSSATNYHTHDNTWRWTGSETGGDWYDPKNWTLYDSTGNVVDTSGSSFSGNAVPQSEQNADVNVGTYNSAIQNVIVANAPSYNQIRSLSVWQNGTLEITAQADSTYGGYVFAAAGFENDGTILINTAGRVELGGISANRNGGTLTIMNNDNNVVFDTNKVNNAGTINLINAALGAATNPLSISGGTVNLSQDSSLFLYPGEYISTINVDPNTINTVYVEANFLLQTDSSNAQSVVINGVSANTHFGISGVSSAPTAATYTPNADGSYTLQVTLADGRLLTFGNIHTADGFVPATNASIVQDGTNGWVVEDNGNAPCFLAGSMIRTPEGDVAVETLRLGSTVLAFVNGETVERKVTWAGRSHMIAKAGLADAEAGYPVRIMQGALAEGVPYKDMLVTPEHCLFINGGFIPARMLVNGRSVVYDRTIAVYDYFHVETAEHSVIMADGMLTESYLDTGNRQSFRQDGSVVALGGRERNWNDDAAAPLSVSRDVVEPIFREIEARAIAAGLENTVAAPALTEDANLYLVASTGQTIHQVRTANGRAMFMIPSDVTGVRIMSRTSSPSETVGPFVDDRRQLGVLVGEVTLFDSGNTISIDQHLTDAGLSGWDVQESTPVRWTNGNAMLPLTARQPNSLGMLAIQILAAGPYLATSEADVALTA